MDFADATLVVLGEELETDWVFTLDRRGFSAYRLGQRKTFQNYPVIKRYLLGGKLNSQDP